MAVFKNELDLDASKHNKSMDDAAGKVKQYDKAIRDAERETKNQIAAQKALAREMNKLKSNADAAKGSVMNLVGAFKSSNFQDIGRDITSLGNALKGMNGKNFGQLAQAFGVSGAQLSSLAAVAGPAAAAVAGVAATKAFIEFNIELDKTTNKVQEITGIAREGSQYLSSQITAVAGTFGKDFDETLGAIDTLMSHFGVSGEEALRLIQDGLVAGADAGGNFYNMLSSYSGAFKDAGIEADQLVAIMSQTKNGLFGEEGMDAIVKATQNIRMMKDSTSQALAQIGIDGKKMAADIASGQTDIFTEMKKVATKMQEFGGDSEEVGKVLAEVFGKTGVKAGSDFADAIAGLTTNLAEAKEGANENNKALDELANAHKDLQNIMQQLFGVSSQGWSTMGTQIKTKLIRALIDAINYVIEMYNNSEFLRTKIAITVGVVSTAFRALGSMFSYIGRNVQILYKALDNLIHLKFDALAHNLEEFWQSIKQVYGDIKNDVENGIKDASSLPEEIKIKLTYDTTPEGGGGGTTKGGSGGTTPKGSGGSTTKKGSGSTPKKGGTTKSGKDRSSTEEFDKESLADYEKRLAELEKKRKNSKLSEEQIIALDRQIAQMELKVRDAKIYLDIIPELSVDKLSDSELEKLHNLYTQAGDERAKDTEFEMSSRKAVNAVKNIKMPEMSGKFSEDEIALQSFQDALIKLLDVYKEYPKALDEVANKFQEFSKLKSDFENGKFDSISTMFNNVEGVDKFVNQMRSAGYTFEEIYEEIQKFSNVKKTFENIELPIDNLENYISLLREQGKAYEDIAEKLKQISELNEMATNFGELGNAISGLGSNISSLGGKAAETIGTITTAVGQTVALVGQIMAFAAAQAVQNAFALPFPANIAAYASVIGMISSAIAIVGGIVGKFANGGIVSGGTSIGDYQLARVNGGEMILNKTQQAHLFNLINANNSTNKSNISNGSVEFKIKGQELVGVLNNYNRKINRI